MDTIFQPMQKIFISMMSLGKWNLQKNFTNINKMARYTNINKMARYTNINKMARFDDIEINELLGSYVFSI